MKSSNNAAYISSRGIGPGAASESAGAAAGAATGTSTGSCEGAGRSGNICGAGQSGRGGGGSTWILGAGSAEGSRSRLAGALGRDPVAVSRSHGYTAAGAG